MTRPRLRRSVVWKLFASVAGCVAAVLVAVFLLNTFALKNYYIGRKKQQVVRAFTTINAVCGDSEQLQDTLTELQDSGSVATLIWSDRQVLYSSLNADRFVIHGNRSYDPGAYELAVTGEDVILADSPTGEQAILLVGSLNNGWHIYLRSPVAAIEESVAETNRFLLFAGLGALLLGLLPTWWVARKFTDPLRQLSALADRVAQLDFSGRYTGQQQDEVGALGESINAMSAALETTVTELKNANARLQADIRQREELDHSRRAFIANVSHELKTPLALIGTYAEGLREDIDGGGENRQYYCEVIEDEAHRVTQMLRRMTMLMQLEGGGSQLEICRFDVAELLGNLLEREQVRLREKGAAAEWEYPGAVDVYADPFLIENVLTTYLSNALNHVTPGGVVRATVTRPSAQRVRITVFNTGEPIPTEELPRIRESFYKVDKARTRAYGGSGIGLSVVAAIMKAHGMPYGVENTPDGVAFYIELESR